MDVKESIMKFPIMLRSTHEAETVFLHYRLTRLRSALKEFIDKDVEQQKRNKKMPLNEKGKTILNKMEKEYKSVKKGKEVFYASENKGTIKGVTKKTGKKK